VHTTSLRAHDFELTVDGEPGTVETLFEGFDEHDRLGVVITADHGAGDPRRRRRADPDGVVYCSRGRALRPNVTVSGSELAESFVTAMLTSGDAPLEAHALRGGLRPPDGLPSRASGDRAARRPRDAGVDQGLRRPG
jgi:hypothetical protein